MSASKQKKYTIASLFYEHVYAQHTHLYQALPNIQWGGKWKEKRMSKQTDFVGHFRTSNACTVCFTHTFAIMCALSDFYRVTTALTLYIFSIPRLVHCWKLVFVWLQRQSKIWQSWSCLHDFFMGVEIPVDPHLARSVFRNLFS